jgi:ABC-type uncharacterized transport system YnjBCD permease subunit
VIWGHVHPIMPWFEIGVSPWQALDQFEKKSFVNVEKHRKNLFFNMKKYSICQTMFINISRIKC